MQRGKFRRAGHRAGVNCYTTHGEESQTQMLAHTNVATLNPAAAGVSVNATATDGANASFCHQ